MFTRLQDCWGLSGLLGPYLNSGKALAVCAPRYHWTIHCCRVHNNQIKIMLFAQLPRFLLCKRLHPWARISDTGFCGPSASRITHNTGGWQLGRSKMPLSRLAGTPC